MVIGQLHQGICNLALTRARLEWRPTTLNSVKRVDIVIRGGKRTYMVGYKNEFDQIHDEKVDFC